VVTFNVMMDKWNGVDYKHMVAAPDIRFEHQDALLFGSCTYDVVMLNEVTQGRVGKAAIEEDQVGDLDHAQGCYVSLESNRCVRENYLIVGKELIPADGMGNLILVSRALHVHGAESINLDAKFKRPALAIDIHFSNSIARSSLTLVSAHLSALASNTQRRQQQLATLCTALEQKERVVIAGDLNFHAEDELVPEPYSDAWSSCHGCDAGFTFDSATNAMIQQLWPLGYESRRMRLDRVFNKNVAVAEVKLCMDSPIYPRAFDAYSKQSFAAPESWGLRTLQFWPRLMKEVGTGLLGFPLLRPPVGGYLFPSDHFGLQFEVNVLSKL